MARFKSYRDIPGSRLRCEFLPGRIRFAPSGRALARRGGRPPFGCCLLIWSA